MAARGASPPPGPGAGLGAWLAWQEALHPAGIALGLDRVREVAARLGLLRLPFPVVTVAGTNGKGSVVAFLEAVLGAAGRRTGAYTSPHLLRYTERLRVGGGELPEAAWCEAFAAVEAARGGVPLTYFEFGTLAAAWLMARSGVEVGLLEVGLGGRLDAVNLWDPEVAVITTVGLDHQAWLGPDREAIGREKAGILRPGRPAVLGEAEPPASVLAEADRLGCPLRRAGRDFRALPGEGPAWRWEGAASLTLPPPGLAGRHQLGNAAAALEAAALVLGRPPRRGEAAAVAEARLPGRLQALDGRGLRLVDVAHNPQAAQALAGALAALPQAPDGRPARAVLAMLADKDAEGVARALAPLVGRWHLAPSTGPRGLGAQALAERLAGVLPAGRRRCHAGLEAALAAAHEEAGAAGRVVVLGSFQAAEAALRRPALWGGADGKPGGRPGGRPWARLWARRWGAA